MPEIADTALGEKSSNSDGSSTMPRRQPPPVAPRNINISLQPWQSSTPSGEYGNGRSASMDSLESNSSAGGNSHRSPGTNGLECMPSRIGDKNTKLQSHNPLQFVKVHSPLYKKAEPQVKQTKEVKVARQVLKEGEEEWQSNLDNWKSRRRKVSEKVIQRAEEMRKIEAEEQLRKEQFQQQQRKIKKFSEIIERRSSSISYNLDLYISQGHDSGLGGTPEPDDTLDSNTLTLRSDTSEGMTSEAESIDSDIHKSDKVIGKELPKVPQKPHSRLKQDRFINEFDTGEVPEFNSPLANKDSSGSDNFSSTEPSDIEGHACDSETVSSEEDLSYISDVQKPESVIEINSEGLPNNLKCHLQKQDETNKCFALHSNSVKDQKIEDNSTTYKKTTEAQLMNGQSHSFNICTKPGGNGGFGLTLRGGKDQGVSAYVDSITKCSPADIAGLKEGDKIITLNGAKTGDYSHNSLIFSIKQATYSGILDIVISRATETVSLPVKIETKSTCKKSSFAEKLALFSSGINKASTCPSVEENKSTVIPPKNNENKSTSLVLKRRSTFENGNNDGYISHRKSTCLSEEIAIMKDKNAEKRLSVDLTLSQFNSQETVSCKKDPPPPVPVKPKTRPKTIHDLQAAGLKKDETNEFNSSNFDSIPISFTNLSNMNNHSLHIRKDQQEVNREGKSESSQNSSGCTLSNRNDLPQNLSTVPNLQNVLEHNPVVSSPENDDVFINDLAGMSLDKENKKDLDSDELDGFHDHNNSYDFNTSSEKDYTDATDIQNKKTDEKNEIFNEELSVTESLLPFGFTSTETPFYDGEPSKKLNNEKNSNRNIVVADTEINAYTEVSSTNRSKNATPDIPLELISQTNDLEIADFLPNVTSSKSPEEEPTENIAEFHNLLDNSYSQTENIAEFNNLPDNNYSYADDSSEENVNSQINASPLCLSLEKIDEDDVISASTTTSSETPDTETVIETLPANLSPLPNDESNGEESSKLSHCLDSEIDQSVEIPPPYYTFNEQEEIDAAVNICDKKTFVPDIAENNTEIVLEAQNEEYCRELDESIDQITSLDVIDEIEQRLMQQLEGDLYEELNEGLTTQLEGNISKPWLYFSEESELLEDLTPKNLEPPKEPPPPPPLPENDISDQKIMPFSRCNSTKRIKKELWRRRSDFLGLDSHEGIDIDNILPPPPGLEDILKQEREQNQWLEKRLSLSENEPSYVNQFSTTEPESYDKLYYEYTAEDKDDISKIPSDAESWKESLEEGDSFFDTPLNMPTSNSSDVFAFPTSGESSKASESSQNKAKQNLHTLGAAPKAKIMDSTKWITEKNQPACKKSIEPVFHQMTYNQSYWLEQCDEKKTIVNSTNKLVDRRYSMPSFANPHPDVTVRTWDDRECEIQKLAPKSTISPWTTKEDYLCESYTASQNKEDLYANRLNDCIEGQCDTDVLESELHKCSCCQKGLCEGSAMGIEALSLYFHIDCFYCCLCHMPLGNGSCGTDVQVKNNQLYCSSCFIAD